MSFTILDLNFQPGKHSTTHYGPKRNHIISPCLP